MDLPANTPADDPLLVMLLKGKITLVEREEWLALAGEFGRPARDDTAKKAIAAHHWTVAWVRDRLEFRGEPTERPRECKLCKTLLTRDTAKGCAECHVLICAVCWDSHFAACGVRFERRYWIANAPGFNLSRFERQCSDHEMATGRALSEQFKARVLAKVAWGLWKNARGLEVPDPWVEVAVASPVPEPVGGENGFQRDHEADLPF